MSDADELDARRRIRAGAAEPAEADLGPELEQARAASDELRGRLEAARRSRRQLEDELEGAGEAVRHWRQEAEILVRRAQALEGEARRRAEELAASRRSFAREAERGRQQFQRAQSAEQREAELGRRLEETERELERTSAELESERLRLADAQAGLEHAAELAEVIERAAASRSWRLGHGTMKLLRRLSFRPPVGREDPLARTAQRLRELGDRTPGRPKS